MNFNESRRDFLTVTAKAGAAAAVVASVPAVAGAFNAGAVAAPSADLVFALGQRIGMEAASAIGSFGTPLSITYVDAAGATFDTLRQGIETGARVGVGCGTVCLEEAIPYGNMLAAIYFRDPNTGRTASFEVFPEALSHLEMITQNHGGVEAMMKTPSSSLFAMNVSSQLIFA